MSNYPVRYERGKDVMDDYRCGNNRARGYCESDRLGLSDVVRETQLLTTLTDNHEARKRTLKMLDEENAERWVSEACLELDDSQLLTLKVHPSRNTVQWENLPDNLRECVYYIANSCGWDYLPVLLFMLVSISAATRGKYEVAINPAWSELVVLYLFICAEQGEMKSSVFKLCNKSAQMFEDSLQMEYFQNSQDGNFGHKNSIAPELVCHATSAEQLCATMSLQGGGCSMMSEEGNTLSTLINGSRRLTDIFTKAFNGEKHSFREKNGRLHLLPKPFMNIGIFATPDVMSLLLRSKRLAGSGLTARTMYCFGGEAYRQEIYEVENSSYIECQNKIFDLYSRHFSQELWRETKTITVSQDAQNELEEIREKSKRYIEKLPIDEPALRGYYSKSHGLVVRIAAVLHIWRHQEPEQYEVSNADILIAKDIVFALDSHAEDAFRPDGIQAQYDAAKIVSWIQRHNHRRFTSTNVARGVSNMSNPTIFPALDLLERKNYIRQLVRPGHPRLCVVHRQVIS